MLWLNPTPDTPWVAYYSPMDAEAGCQQTRYQEAITAADAAVDAGDIETVRPMRNGKLSGIFTGHDATNAIQQVVDPGDPDALRQLFSRIRHSRGTPGQSGGMLALACRRQTLKRNSTTSPSAMT
ncbi:hypothetical protein [Microbacterium sp. G2-8]|uniref:hypothetical protein n=1 Tax=Microbacterium sp. G2-8 TaxID=2842454 RepID=UPI001C8A1296|nr:hypothetical protein [Microbacterium sp. G2-8]